MAEPTLETGSSLTFDPHRTSVTVGGSAQAETDPWGPAPPVPSGPPPLPPTVGRRRGRRFSRWVGGLLVVAGLVAVGIALLQPWAPTTETQRSQSRLADRFETRLDLVASGTPVADLGGPQTTASAEEIVEAAAGFPADDNPVVVPAGADLVSDPAPASQAAAGILPELGPEQGEALGRIVIPAAGVDWIMVEGVDPEELALGPGHMPWTPVPGQPGNAVVSGHRTTHGAPFYELDEVQRGDVITVETLLGTHVYEVLETRIVKPNDVWVTTQWDGAWLTLTTCHPAGSAAERLIVFAHLVHGPNYEAISAQFDGPYVVEEPAGT